MKTVIITGSTKGLGFEMAKCFRERGCNVVLNGSNQQRLDAAVERLRAVSAAGKVLGVCGPVEHAGTHQALLAAARDACGAVDIYINNAGVNQPMVPLWELTDAAIQNLMDVDLCGTVYGSREAAKVMLAQGHGAIYNVEGYGSNEAMMLGLSMYGTCKRAVTYHTRALAKELATVGSSVIAGRLSPGIILTDFTTNAVGGESIALPEKTKNFYNIAGDYPDVIAAHLVEGMLKNEKNDAHIQWLTTAKMLKKFITARKNKHDFFSGK